MAVRDAGQRSSSYKWTALSNTTLGVFMASVDSSIVIISLPAIFRGIHLDPLQPSNIKYLLWLLQGYLVVTAGLGGSPGRPRAPYRPGPGGKPAAAARGGCSA